MEHQTPAGTYGSGISGHQHTRIMCAQTLADASEDIEDVTDIVSSLYGPMPSDGWDEIEACGRLSELLPLDGYWWGWLEEDFGLWPEGSDVG